MTTRQSLEEAIGDALLEHADAAHLPLSVPHVRAQAAVAAHAAKRWSAATVGPVAKPPQKKPVPPDSDPAPDHPTGGAPCWHPVCAGEEPSVGWRWYLPGAWKATCDRHLTGAPTPSRRYNRDYERSS